MVITTICGVLKKFANTVRSLDPKKRCIAIIAVVILLIFICPLFIPPTTPEFYESGGDTDTNGEYLISWKWSTGAISYTVEEALDHSFTNCKIVHSGIKREKCIYEKSTGIYFYRVKACNIVCESGWSTPKRINVSIPKETKNRTEETTAGDKETTAGDKETTAGDKETTAGDKETTAGDKETTAGAKETTAGDKETTAGDKETTAVKTGETTPVNATPTPNQRPRNATLEPNMEEPQRTCTDIEWTASAIDPEGDKLSYLFRTRGPATGNEWRDIRNWSFDNTWIWETSPDDIGDTDICVRIRDGYDEPPYPQDIYYDYAMKNDPPENAQLNPSVKMPQKVNTTIPWIASATDPDEDTLFYRFIKMSPSKNQEIVRNWNTSNRWSWHTNNSDLGTSTIIVWIRDGYHYGADSYDCKEKRSYLIQPYLNFS